MVPRRLLLIVNPAAGAGQGRRRFERLLPGLQAGGLRPDIVFTTGEGEARRLATEAAPAYDTVVAAGGDGTTREVASGLLGGGPGRACLGVLPLGTGNDFAVQTGLAFLPDALAALQSGDERRVDAIRVDWRREDGDGRTDHALLFAAAGFAAQVGRRTTPAVKRWFGRRGAYPVAFFHALLELRPFEVRVDVDGSAHAGRFFHVCAGNSPRAGGGAMHLSPGARMDDGRLEICLVEGVSRMEVLRCFPRLLRGTFPGHPQVRYFPGRRLAVETVPSTELSLDGDVVGRTPATFEVLPGALRLRVPPGRPQVGLDSNPAVD